MEMVRSSQEPGGPGKSGDKALTVTVPETEVEIYPRIIDSLC